MLLSFIWTGTCAIAPHYANDLLGDVALPRAVYVVALEIGNLVVVWSYYRVEPELSSPESEAFQRPPCSVGLCRTSNEYYCLSSLLYACETWSLKVTLLMLHWITLLDEFLIVAGEKAQRLIDWLIDWLIFIKARNKRTCNKLNMTINQRSERKEREREREREREGEKDAAILLWCVANCTQCRRASYSFATKCHSSALPRVLAEICCPEILSIANKYNVHCLDVSVGQVRRCVWQVFADSVM